MNLFKLQICSIKVGNITFLYKTQSLAVHFIASADFLFLSTADKQE